MGKFDGVLLASDFDNTLLNTETARRTGAEVPEVSRRNREALEYFMAGGGRFAIATGRALAAFIKFADQVPMNAPGIVCNGAALYDFQKGEYLETILLDESTRRRGQETLDRFPTLAVEAYHIDSMRSSSLTGHCWRSPPEAPPRVAWWPGWRSGWASPASTSTAPGTRPTTCPC